MLIEKYAAKVIILGGPDDTDICDSVLKAMKQKAISACGRTTILQFAALLKKCVLTITNDGGPLHVAVAVDINTISLFGPVDENVYGPYSASKKHIVLKQDINCRPCYKEFKLNQCQSRRCLLNIRPQDAIKAAGELL